MQGHSVVGACERLISDPSSCTGAGAGPLPAWIFIDCNSTLHKISLAFSLLLKKKNRGCWPDSPCEQALHFPPASFLIRDYSFMNGWL